MEIKNSQDLQAAIFELEGRTNREKQALVGNFHALTESLTPLNLIKSTFNKVKDAPGLTGNVIKAGVGLGVGILSKKFLLGNSPGVVKRLLGSAIKMSVAGLVAKNSETIKDTGGKLFKNIFRSKSKH